MTSSPTATSDYGDYDYDEPQTDPEVLTPISPSGTDAAIVFLAVVNVFICVLGVAGNGLVMWIAGFKLKKSINTTWYLSLAMSDFLFCFFLPFSVVYMVKHDWIFGRSICKFMSFIMFLNMFSSIFLLVIISVDRCVAVRFPVWAQNQRTIRKASAIVLLAWILSAVISSPAIIFREVKVEQEVEHHIQHRVCYNDYTKYEELTAVTLSRFIFGFVIPILTIVVCYVLIIQKLSTNQMARSKKPFKIMTALIVAFFICWLPYHIVALMELDYGKYHHILHAGQRFGATLATANSCMNPFLYAFMGKDFKKKCYAILSKIENAIEEEGRSTAQRTSITTSGDGRLSTAV